MTAQPIEFKVDGLQLRGNIYLADKPKDLALLFIHGWTGMPNNDAAGVLADNGFSCLTFSLSGHNNSDGRIEDQTRRKSLNEVIAAYDVLKSHLPVNTKIGAVGTSYGSYLAAVLATKRTIACLSMRVPANYLDKDFEEPQAGQGADNAEVTKWRQQKLDYNATKALRAVHNFKGPIQIIEAELDERVPHQTVQNYVSAVSSENQLDYHFMKGWPHSLGMDKKRNSDYQRILLNWALSQ
jgi:esterase/lipase